MPVMDAQDRRDLVNTLALWHSNAQAGVQCSTDVPPAIISLIKKPSDKPADPGGP